MTTDDRTAATPFDGGKNGLCKVPICAMAVPWGHLLCKPHYARLSSGTQRELNRAWKGLRQGTVTPEEYEHWRDTAIQEAAR